MGVVSGGAVSGKSYFLESFSSDFTETVRDRSIDGSTVKTKDVHTARI